MSPEDMENVYFRALCAYRWLPVLDAAEAARGLVARDSLSRWWEVPS